MLGYHHSVSLPSIQTISGLATTTPSSDSRGNGNNLTVCPTRHRAAFLCWLLSGINSNLSMMIKTCSLFCYFTVFCSPLACLCSSSSSVVQYRLQSCSYSVNATLCWLLLFIFRGGFLIYFQCQCEATLTSHSLLLQSSLCRAVILDLAEFY